MAFVFDMLKDVSAGRQTWKIKVRVVRLWTVASIDEPTKPFAIEMVLMDSEGTKIQGSVRKPMMRKFRGCISEGEVYKMSFFGVVKNCGAYRATKHEYKLLFHSRTRIVPSESSIIPLFGLSVVTPEEVLATNGDCDYLIDVIGVVTAVSDERTYAKEGRNTRMMVIDIADSSSKIQCAMFGNYVDVIKDFVRTTVAELPIIVIQLAKIKNYKGDVVIQNVMNSTRILWNADLPEVNEFKERLARAGFALDREMGRIDDRAKAVPLRDDFLDMYPRKTINGLHTTEEEGVFIVLAEVLTVLVDDHWWYTACKCHKAVTPDGGLYYCGSCCTHVVEVTPRFKLKLEVFDGEDTAAFVLFDDDAAMLLKTSCAALILEVQDPKSQDHPKLFQSVVGKELLFKVEKGSDYAFRYDDSFKVKRICDDASIIEAFKDKESAKTPLKSIFKPPFPKVEEDNNAAVESEASFSVICNDSDVAVPLSIEVAVNNDVVDLAED